MSDRDHKSRSINPSPASLGKSLSLKYSGYWRISFKPSLVHVPRTCSAAARARRGPARLPASAALPGPLEVKKKVLVRRAHTDIASHRSNQ